MVYNRGVGVSYINEGKNSEISTKNGDKRLLNVRMTLSDVLYISYALPAEKMRALVPDNLSLATAGHDMSFISIVALRSTRVRLSLMPLLRFNYHQLNIRTYVVDPVSGKHAVYFIRSGVTSRFISLATRMSGIPWQYIDMESEVNVQNKTDSYVAFGNWGEDFSIKAQACSNDCEKPPLFENRKSAVDFLIRPLIGFIGDNRKIGRFTIYHPEVEPESYTLTEFCFPLFTNLGVVDDLLNPHSVFYLTMADFSIYLPPTRIK